MILSKLKVYVELLLIMFDRFKSSPKKSEFASLWIKSLFSSAEDRFKNPPPIEGKTKEEVDIIEVESVGTANFIGELYVQGLLKPELIVIALEELLPQKGTITSKAMRDMITRTKDKLKESKFDMAKIKEIINKRCAMGLSIMEQVWFDKILKDI